MRREYEVYGIQEQEERQEQRPRPRREFRGGWDGGGRNGTGWRRERKV